MDTPDNPSTESMPNENFNETCMALRRQVNILLLALVLVSSTLSVYLYMQDRWTSHDLQAAKGPASQMIQTFERQELPRIDAFKAKLLEYGKAHPDFAPILEKYKNFLMPSPAAEAPKN